MRMKKATKITLLVLLLALCAGMLAGCGGGETQSDAGAPFVWIYSTGLEAYRVGYDRDTGVMYCISNGYSNSGTLTMLVNADGTPKVWEGYNANHDD